MTPAELASAIWQRAASLKAAGRLTKENFVSEVAGMIEDDAKMTEDAPLGPPVLGRAAPKLADKEWLAQLALNEAYQDIDIKREFAKMMAWAGERHAQPTRRRFLNWLNKVERPMAPQEPAKPQIDTYKEPPLGWRLHLAKLAPEYTGQSWDTVRLAFGRRIWQAVLLEQSRHEAK
jgi:hypothetical protein